MTRGREVLSPSGEIDALLARARGGDDEAVGGLMPLVYDELRRIAARYMRREWRGVTLQPTALVHEVYMRLLRDRARDWRTRAHFVAIAATAMRQILVERARARGAAKRGGRGARVTVDSSALAARAPAVDLEAIDEALARLARFDARQARVVELRFFGGLTVEEAAEVLGLSPATVKREWSVARAWLRRELERGADRGR